MKKIKLFESFFYNLGKPYPEKKYSKEEKALIDKTKEKNFIQEVVINKVIYRAAIVEENGKYTIQYLSYDKKRLTAIPQIIASTPEPPTKTQRINEI